MMKEYKPRGSTLLWVLACIFGVVLPALTLGIEMCTAMCAEVFFDPIPTYFHVLLVAFVPFANFVTILWLRKGAPEVSEKTLSRYANMNSVAFAIALFYALIFLPMVPIAFIGVVAWGLGFLPMSPLLALPSTLVFRSYIHGASRQRSRLFPTIFVGTSIVALLLFSIEFHSGLTHIGMQMSLMENPLHREQGVKFLRSFAEPGVIYELASGTRAPHISLPALLVNCMGKHIRRSKASEIYYRVYGQHWSKAPLHHRNRRWSWRKVEHRRYRFHRDGAVHWDSWQGTSYVGPELSGLSMTSSRFEGTTDGDGALGYLEWTMIFRNESKVQREARALVSLPTDGVVSRVTLWVKGEECEAAFAGKAKVKAAYQRIVRRRRDPLLVTEKGKGRVLVQCFPIEPNKTMKIRLGITFPLFLPNKDRGTFNLPQILERNFAIPKSTAHYIWFESKRPMDATTMDLKSDEKADGRYSLSGNLTNGAFANTPITINTLRDSSITEVWCSDIRDVEEGVIRQRFVDYEHAASPRHLYVILDGSVTMKNHLPAIKVALASIPKNIKTTLFRAGEMVEELKQPLENFNCAGGCDNALALQEAINRAEAEGQTRACILWLHGPQPIHLSTNSLAHNLSRASLPCYHLQVQSGMNVVVSDLTSSGLLKVVPRHGQIVEDLEGLFNRWAGSHRVLAGYRLRVAYEVFNCADEGSHETSAHLVRLWARDEVERLARSRKKGAREKAVELAARWQLVTSVSGAVVLESAAQFKEAGLEAVDKNTVPTVPEPEEWALIILTLFFLTYSYRQKKRNSRQLVGGFSCCAA